MTHNRNNSTNKKESKDTWAIGGGIIVGVGLGLFFLEKSPLAFIGSIILGLGLGLIITAVLSNKKGQVEMNSGRKSKQHN